MKRIAILQSNYIPWKGYFDIIKSVDEFVFLDDVQYTRRDWRNRNKIKTQHGIQWLTIPVEVGGKGNVAINEVKVADSGWGKSHWETIKRSYAKAEHFADYKELFAELYLNTNEEYLSLINYKFIKAICEMLRIKTKLLWSNEVSGILEKSERLLEICKALKGDIYLSGPAAKDYLNTGMFEAVNIKVEWMDYGGYPEYRQLFPPFDHYVSVIDLLFNEGPDAVKFMKSCGCEK